MQLTKPKITYNPDGTATVTQKSLFSGKENTLTMKFTEEAYKRWTEGGELIQRALPRLSPSEREFLMTGVTPQEWDNSFPEEGDE